MILWVVGARKFARQLAVLAGRRDSPSRAEFVNMLASDCERDTAIFLWDELSVYWKPETPHPDDDFVHDLAIDGDDVTDWVAEFCRQNDLSLNAIRNWPENMPSTVRNLARWLTTERSRLHSA